MGGHTVTTPDGHKVMGAHPLTPPDTHTAPDRHRVPTTAGHTVTTSHTAPLPRVPVTAAYTCTVCHRSYVTLSSLKRHSNVHSWRRSYPCRFCDKVFALAEYRTKHEVWHTGERRYQCGFCWDTFVTYYNLKSHQKTLHGVNPALLASEKTPNGGYRPKLNALKLYRLLPARGNKRPYRTYTQDAVTMAPVAVTTAGALAVTPQPASVIAFGRPSGVAAAGVALGERVTTTGTTMGTMGTLVTTPPMKKQVLRDYIAAQRAATVTPEAVTRVSPGVTRTMTYVA